MRVSLGLPTHRVDLGQEFVSAEGIAVVSKAAEAAGFDAVFVTDHPFPADDWLVTGGHHALDPLVALAFAASATTHIRLHTNLFIPAYRNPFLSAKGIATLDRLSNGRVILGVGAGYLEGEFAALGADFENRNDMLDEAIAAMKAAWTGDSLKFSGRGYSAAGNTMLPRPAQRPGPPIWIGGNSKRAIRRAVEMAEGWCPMPSPAKAATRLHTPGLESLDDLRERLAYARQHAKIIGRTAPLEIAFMPAGLDMFRGANLDSQAVIDAIGAMAEAGVTYAIVTLPGESRRALLATIERFGAEILPSAATL